MPRSLTLVRAFRIAGFLAIVTLPAIGAFGDHGTLGNEKRQRTPRPALSWGQLGSYPERFTRYWQDTFGFREPLIRGHNLLTVKWLRESPVREVIIGGQGRLFFAGGPIDFTDFAGKWPIDQAEIGRIRQNLERRRDEYAALGARFLVVIAPNKQTVYPESVPDRYGPPAPGYFDALMSALRGSNIDVLDLRPVLRAHKDEELFFKTDTHWNATGAFRAAQAIVERERAHFPQLEPLHLEDFVPTTRPKGNGDLAIMLSMPGEFEDTEIAYNRRGGDRSHRLPVEDPRTQHIYERPHTQGPHLLIFGDSFGEGLARPLSEAFGRVYFLYSLSVGYQPHLAGAEKPDLVILEAVERYIPNLAVD